MSGDVERRLLLLRHAKAVPAGENDDVATDHARALAPRGVADAASLGERLRTEGLAPDRILVSTSLRTRQTVERLLPLRTPAGDSAEPSFEPTLYLAKPETLRAVLAALPDDARTVLLVGHNPGLHELALRLAGSDAAAGGLATFPTCVLAEFAWSGGWEPDPGRNRPRLVRVLRP